jgi:hypothetical protein
VRQQFAIAVFVQMPVPGLHESVVQGSPSLHCGSVEQQPGMPVCWHWCVVVLHASAVHWLVSMQSGVEVQQPVCRELTHVCVARSH